MRVAKRELFIFDDIRPDASDKSAPRFAVSRGPYLYTGVYIFRDRSSPVTHPTRVIPYLCPDDFFAPSIATPLSPAPVFLFLLLPAGIPDPWHGIQLALKHNHLVGLPCVKEDLGREYAFVSRTSTRPYAPGFLPPRLSIGPRVSLYELVPRRFPGVPNGSDNCSNRRVLATARRDCNC